MIRRLIFLILVLAATGGWLIWKLRAKWVEMHQHERAELTQVVAARPVYAPAVNPLFNPPRAVDYNDAVQRVLFFKDRNPNVIVDPPPPPPPAPPPPKMPDLPAYYGTMALFGDPVVLLSLPKGPQKKYHAGDKVGPFTLVSFDKTKVVFDWDGKIVERAPEELKETQASAQEAAAEGPATRVEPVKLIPDPPANAPKVDPKIGPDNGGGVRMCVAGDTTPAGTVIDGYKKVITMNMFGATCMWTQVNQ